MKKKRSPLYGLSLFLCRRYMGTKREKRHRLKVREQLCSLSPLEPAGTLIETYYAERIELVLTILLAGLVLTAAVFFLKDESGGRVTELSRNSQGDGTSASDLEVTIGGQPAGALHITVEEQAFTEEEIDEKLKTAAEGLDAAILGENPSADHVSSDLSFPTALEGGLITVRWESDNPQVVDADGRVHTEDVPAAGVLVNITAALTAQEREYIQMLPVRVEKPPLTKEEAQMEELKTQIEDMEKFRRTAPVLPLPEKIDGQPVTYKNGQEETPPWAVLFLLTLLAAVLAVGGKDAELSRALRRREQQLMMDYSGIIHKLTLLLGAGLTIQDAWGRVTLEYARRREAGGRRRYAYEEMLLSYRELQGGMSPAEVYDRFGRRCRAAGYVKLGALLKQNLTRGNSGLSQLLTYEGVQAAEEQKSVVRKLGEEASTKLLLPMFLMLGVVIVILIVPALMTMGVS